METTGLSRREALSAGGGTAAGLLLGPVTPAEARARRSRRVKRADVVVVGAGISGLTAARRLVQAGVKSVVILEANARVGGRTLNLDVAPGVVTEGGGEWVGPGQDHVLGLIKELGLQTFKTYIDGNTVYSYKGKRQTFSGTIPPLGPAALADYVQLETMLEQMAATVPAETPWTAPNAIEWDATTFGAWLDTHSADAEAKWLLTMAFTVEFGEDPHELSLLRLLHAVATSGGIEHMISVTGGAQEQRVVGGSQQISTAMAKRLGRRVILGSPVSKITQRASDVLVHSERITARCKRVIVAMSPGDADRIHFAPGLPGRRQTLQRKWKNGTESKLFLVYDTPFWRADGYNGQAYSDIPIAPYVSDNSPPDGSVGILVTFMGTAGQGPGLTWSDEVLNDPAARRAAFIDAAVQLWGPKASHPTQYLEKDWSHEPWIKGCVSSRPAGLMTRYGNASREVCGRIHWAGTETGVFYEGYMDGAVSAGERAAKEALGAL
jgi:monoamine oxidase